MIHICRHDNTTVWVHHSDGSIQPCRYYRSGPTNRIDIEGRLAPEDRAIVEEYLTKQINREREPWEGVDYD